METLGRRQILNIKPSATNHRIARSFSIILCGMRRSARTGRFSRVHPVTVSRETVSGLAQTSALTSLEMLLSSSQLRTRLCSNAHALLCIMRMRKCRQSLSFVHHRLHMGDHAGATVQSDHTTTLAKCNGCVRSWQASLVSHFLLMREKRTQGSYSRWKTTLWSSHAFSKRI